jgi:hypothetical protein
MPPRRRRNRSWQRRGHDLKTDPAVILRELQRRQLNDLEDCRLAWQEDGNPLAVCVALTKCDLPEWLTDALLELLTLEAHDPKRGARLRDRWARQHRDDVDAARAQAVALARTGMQPITWDEARVVAERFLREQYTDVEAVDGEALKRSYRLVCERLTDGARYYYAPPEFEARRLRALDAALPQNAARRERARKRVSPTG